MNNLLNELLSGSNFPEEPNGFVFFTEDSVEGYTTKAELLKSLQEQKKSSKSFRINHLKQLFDNMALGRIIISEPSLSKEDGEEVVWVRFAYGKMRLNLQILNSCGMYDFINDYANGLIKNVPTFEAFINSIRPE